MYRGMTNRINKIIRRVLIALLPLCLIALLSQSAFCYTLTSNELHKIIYNKINAETKDMLGDIEYKINIHGGFNDVTTNDSKAPIVEISRASEFNPVSYRRVTVKDSEGNAVKTFSFNVRTLIYMDAYVALEPIVYGKSVNGSNTAKEKKEVSKYFYKVLTYLPDNSVASRGIAKGSVIQYDYVKQKPIIEKNQNVDIVFEGKGVQIILKGKTLKEGAKGQVIPVRSDKYNKTYSATVETNSKVTVRI